MSAPIVLPKFPPNFSSVVKPDFSKIMSLDRGHRATSKRMKVPVPYCRRLQREQRAENLHGPCGEGNLAAAPVFGVFQVRVSHLEVDVRDGELGFDTPRAKGCAVALCIGQLGKAKAFVKVWLSANPNQPGGTIMDVAVGSGMGRHTVLLMVKEYRIGKKRRNSKKIFRAACSGNWRITVFLMRQRTAVQILTS